MYVASLMTVLKTRDMLINRLTEHFATGKSFRMMGSSSPAIELLLD